MSTCGFDYEFVAKVPREYICPICECPMRGPVQTKCGHRFCKRCLTKAMKSKRECPIDRQSLDLRFKQDIYPDVATERTILDLCVKCRNEKNGCKWTGELRNIAEHESKCSFVGVKCTNKDCEATPLKKDLNYHATKECPKRNVECHYCKIFFVWCNKQGHLDVCTKYPMVCLQKCGELKIPRDKMNDHIEENCPHTKVECTFAYIGCKIKVQRKSISDHLRKCTESHLELACGRLQELQVSSTAITATVERMQAEMVTASKKIEELSNAAQKSEGVQDLHEKITLTNKKLKELQTKKDVFELTSGLEAVRAEVGVIRTQMEALSEEDKKLVELREAVISLQKKIQKIDSQQVSHGDVSKIKTKLQNLQKAFTSLENQTSSNVEIVREQIDSVQWKIHATVWSDRKQNQSRLDETVKDYSARLDQMKHFIVWVVIIGMCFLHSISISSFSSKEELKVLQASSAEIKQFVFENTHFLKDESACQSIKFFWSFFNFRSRFEKAIAASQRCFFSESFFVEPYGYKMRLTICPDGPPEINFHLSVYAQLLRGRNDDQLVWPFQQKVVFTLVDQQDNTSKTKNIRKVLTPTRKGMPRCQQLKFARPSKSHDVNNDVFGIHRFISHLDLKKRRYVRDDTILIQFEVYPPLCD